MRKTLICGALAVLTGFAAPAAAQPPASAPASGAGNVTTPFERGGRDSVGPTPPAGVESRQTTPSGQLLLLRAERIRRVGTVTIAEGNVSAEMAGIRLDCQRLEYDSLTGLAKARQECIFFWGENYAAADQIDLDTRGRTAMMQKVAGRGTNLGTSSRAMEQPLFFWADALEWTQEKASLLGATLTTCDEIPSDWHYSIKAEKIDIFPRERLDAYNSSITVGNTKLLTLPNQSFSLNPNRELLQDLIPTIGYSGVFGAFLRSNIPIRFDKNNFGRIHLDYYTRTGLAGGLEHNFTLGNRGGGSIFYYQQNGVQEQAGRFELRGNVGYQLDQYTNVGFSYGQNRFELPGFVSPLNVGTSFALSRYAPGNAFSVGTNFARSGDNTNSSYRLFWETDLSERTTVTLAGDYAFASTLFARTQRSHYLAQILHREDWFDMDLGLENTGGQNTFFLNRTPEFRFRTHPLFVGPVPVLAMASFGNIQESPSNFRTNRWDLRVMVPDQTIDVGSGRVSMGAGYRQFFYGNGSSQRVFTSRANWVQNIGDSALARLDLNIQLPGGDTPFQHDIHYPYQTLTGGLEVFDTGAYRLATYAGWDFRLNQMHDLVTRLDFNPGPGWSVSTGTNFDPNGGRFRSVDNQLSIQVTDNIYVSHWSLYDVQQAKITYQDFIINFSEHDWDAQIAYRGIQNEVFFQFALKAFPTPRIKIGPNTSQPILPQNLPNAFVRELPVTQ